MPKSMKDMEGDNDDETEPFNILSPGSGGLLFPGRLCQRGNNDANPAPGTDEHDGYPDDKSQLSAAHRGQRERKNNDQRGEAID